MLHFQKWRATPACRKVIFFQEKAIEFHWISTLNDFVRKIACFGRLWLQIRNLQGKTIRNCWLWGFWKLAKSTRPICLCRGSNEGEDSQKIPDPPGLSKLQAIGGTFGGFFSRWERRSSIENHEPLRGRRCGGGMMYFLTLKILQSLRLPKNHSV